MVSDIYDNIFARAQAGERNFVEVLINYSAILRLPEGQPGAIATRRLGGCSAVVVLGLTGAIMAHIAPIIPGLSHSAPGSGPGPGPADEVLSDSEQHFENMLRQVENLYTNNRRHFPDETIVRGFYLKGFKGVTRDLEAIATRSFANLGLRIRHGYYKTYSDPDRRDEIRIRVRIDGMGTSSLYLETTQTDIIRFPVRLPTAYTLQRIRQSVANNSLFTSIRFPEPMQMFFAEQIVSNLTRVTQSSDVIIEEYDGTTIVRKFDFPSYTWMTYDDMATDR